MLSRVRAGKSSPVWSWWRQAQRQAAEQKDGAEPMLWMRHRREPWLVLVRAAWVDALPDRARISVGHVSAFGVGAWDAKRGAEPVALSGDGLLRLPPAMFARAPSGMRRRFV